MTLPPIQNLQTTDNNMRLLINQLHTWKTTLDEYTAKTDANAGTAAASPGLDKALMNRAGNILTNRAGQILFVR
jgi:hypothetical protein